MKSKYLVLGASIAVGLLAMNVVVASGGDHRKSHDVGINEVGELECGSQQMSFGGYVDMHEGHELIVELDDSVIPTTINNDSWWTGLHAVGVGAHTLLAYLTNSGEGDSAVSDLIEFDVEPCETESPTPTPTDSPSPSPSDEPKEEGSDDPGDEEDCEISTNPDACGEGYINEEPEAPAPTVAPVGGVKGVTTEATPAPVEELVELPSAGPNPLLPLTLVGSWLSVAAVGFKKKW